MKNLIDSLESAVQIGFAMVLIFLGITGCLVLIYFSLTMIFRITALFN